MTLFHLLFSSNFSLGYKFSVTSHKLNGHAIGPPREKNLSSGVCEQHRRRPSCASVQFDQRLCYLLIGKYHIQTCYKLKFNSKASLCSWAGRYEFHFFGNPEDRFCCDGAHIIQVFCTLFLCRLPCKQFGSRSGLIIKLLGNCDIILMVFLKQFVEKVILKKIPAPNKYSVTANAHG